MLNPFRAAAASAFGSLMLSTSTLVCCALPALAVALGAGAVLASLVTTFPFLVVVSLHKGITFSGAAVGLTLGGWLQWRQRFAACPTDPVLARACGRARKVSLRIYVGSLVLFATGGYFAFVLPAIRHALKA